MHDHYNLYTTKYIHYLYTETQQTISSPPNYPDAKFLIPNIHNDQLIRINSDGNRRVYGAAKRVLDVAFDISNTKLFPNINTK